MAKTKLIISNHSGTFSATLYRGGYVHSILKGGTKEQAALVLASCEGMNAMLESVLEVDGMSLLK